MESKRDLDLDYRHTVERSRASLRRMLDEALLASGAEEGGILVRDELTWQLRVEASEGPGVSEKPRIIDPDPKKSLCAACAERSQSIYVPDIPNSSQPFLPLSNTPILSAFVIPIEVDGICVGLVNLESLRRDAFTAEQQEETRRLVFTLSRDFQIAKLDIERAFLHGQLRAVEGILNSIQQVRFSSTTDETTDEDEYRVIYGTILEHSLRVAEADTGGLLLLTPDRSHLRLVAATNLRQDENPVQLGKRIPRGEGITWMCLESQPPKIVNVWNVHAPEYIARFVDFSAPKVRSELAVPLVSQRDGVLGVINIESTSLNAFGLEHERMLKLFATEAALFLSLVRLYGKWRGASALASYGDMSANLAHRMNNYIGGIRAVAQVLTEDASAGVEFRDNAAKIVEATEDALRVVREYRDLFAQAEITVDLKVQISSVVNEFAAKKSHQISFELPTSPVLVRAAPPLITELCRELIRNATKYTPEGKPIEVKLVDLPGLAVLSVADGGPGLPKDREERLFERGYRGKTSAPGTGYGLWWARQFIAMLGGRIGAANRSEGGTIFTVEIPTLTVDRGGMTRD